MASLPEKQTSFASSSGCMCPRRQHRGHYDFYLALLFGSPGFGGSSDVVATTYSIIERELSLSGNKFACYSCTNGALEESNSEAVRLMELETLIQLQKGQLGSGSRCSELVFRETVKTTRDIMINARCMAKLVKEAERVKQVLSANK
ncbi:hypothetical protein KIN20_019611 [Parelaphostrongylus tenuis]|uniref:Uncharacterized protein n=1 Tax=Parelaphostrongylus tenuis TaxID=148309 RepID=A0AAD5N2D9_PARTN|nr:hypothetical protein KIN20_019611 [Parelaphostrongylus tenuis]